MLGIASVQLRIVSCGGDPADGVCDDLPSVRGKVQTELDARVKAWRERELRGDWQYLFLDAAWAKAIVGVHATRVCLLSAKAVDVAGRVEMLGFERAPIENESG